MLGAFFDDCLDFVLGEEFFCYKVLEFRKRLQKQNVSFLCFCFRGEGFGGERPVRAGTRPFRSSRAEKLLFFYGQNFLSKLVTRKWNCLDAIFP
jgi:hypothetical protein